MPTQPYLETIILTQTTPCLADPSKIIVTGQPSRPLDEVLPYLATLPNVIGFNPETLTLTMRRQPGFITLYIRRVNITHVKDVAEGLSLLRALTDAINTTWEHRHELQPLTVRKRPPRPLEIYFLLPRTNCKQCGQATCMAFACFLLLGHGSPNQCLPLCNEPAYHNRLKTLEALIKNG